MALAFYVMHMLTDIRLIKSSLYWTKKVGFLVSGAVATTCVENSAVGGVNSCI